MTARMIVFLVEISVCAAQGYLGKISEDSETGSAH